MIKKNFDTQAATSKFFTQQPQNAHDKHEKHSTQEEVRSPGRPKKTEAEKLRGYRYNLNLDRDLKPFLHEIVWQKRTSITQYINDLIRHEMEKYFRECEAAGKDPMEGWELDEP